jgi:hypothetical protein
MSSCVVCFRRINHMAVKNHLHSSFGVREVVLGTIILRQALPPLTFLTIWLSLFHPLLCHYLHVDDPPIGCCPVAMNLLVDPCDTILKKAARTQTLLPPFALVRTRHHANCYTGLSWAQLKTEIFHIPSLDASSKSTSILQYKLVRAW